MTDDSKARPLDPTQNAQDMMGDTTGKTGITTGGKPQSSNNDARQVAQNMSSTKAQFAEDRATDDSSVTAPSTHSPAPLDTQSKNTSWGNGHVPKPIPPQLQDETSASGSAPDPSSDDDTLQNAQNMGMQLEEDEEHPQELDIARDVDKAEEYIRQH